MANNTGVTLFRPPVSTIPVIAPNYGDREDEEDDDDDVDDDEEESYSISSTSSSPRNKQNPPSKRERSRKKMEVGPSGEMKRNVAYLSVDVVKSFPF